MPTALCVKRALLATTLILLIGLSTLAQMETATLSGVIQDPKGAVVPDVEVVATRIETGSATTTKTNGAGIYVFTGLQPGHYHLDVRKPGFKEIAIKDFELHTQDKLEQNFSLEIGSMSETVTVNADSEHMATDNPAVGLLVNHDFVDNMPLNGRSLQDLISLAPGAVSSSRGDGLYSVNGQREDANYFTVDGVGANLNNGNNLFNIGGISGDIPTTTALGTTQSLISVDALQEFKIQTSTYMAEYGRQPGAQVGFTSRSGANSLHGTAYDYFRNNALDANSWAVNYYHEPKPIHRQNDFGGTLGGPLEIPRLYDGKDKTFFFFSYEGLRLDTPVFSGLNEVPTVAFRQFASPAFQPFLNSFPLPNGPAQGDQCASSFGPTFSCSAQWETTWVEPSTIDSFSGRLDQTISKKAQIFARISDTPSKQTGFQAGQSAYSTGDSFSSTVGATLNVSNGVTDELRFNYSTFENHNSSSPVGMNGSIPYAKGLVVPAQYLQSGIKSFAGMLFEGPSEFFNVPSYDDTNVSQHQYNLTDSLSWTKSRHTLKFGLDYRRLTPEYSPEAFQAIYVIESVMSAQQGVVDAGQISSQEKVFPTFTNLSLYAQDNWKISDRLTVDYGLRWEFNPAPGAANGIYPLALTSGNPATAAFAPQGTPQYRTRYRNFAPRLGVAYHVNNSTRHAVVVRSGFGIFYDTGQNLGASGYSNYPFANYTPLKSLPFPISNDSITVPPVPAPLTPPYGSITGASDPNLRLPYTEQWSVSADYGVSSRNTFTMSYVGNEGKHLLYQAFYQPKGNVYLGQGVQFANNAAFSNYNALQLQDQGYLAPGLQLIASYTWSHSIDNQSTDITGGFCCQRLPIRGNSDNDIRHVLTSALNYQIPGVASSDRLLRSLTQGWLLAQYFTAQSGSPITVYQGTFTLPNGQTPYVYPNLVPGVPIYLHGVAGVPFGWELNKAAFSSVSGTNPSTGLPNQGDLGRNFIHGPNFWAWNTSLQRNFPLTEVLRLSFRVDAFNVLNHPNPYRVQPRLTSSAFGQAIGGATIGSSNSLYATGGPRSLQLSLKLAF